MSRANRIPFVTRALSRRRNHVSLFFNATDARVAGSGASATFSHDALDDSERSRRRTFPFWINCERRDDYLPDEMDCHRAMSHTFIFFLFLRSYLRWVLLNLAGTLPGLGHKKKLGQGRNGIRQTFAQIWIAY